jgi:hypothetical protein
MTATRACLRTFVQCRPLWLWHLWGALICLPALLHPLFRPQYRDGAIFSILLVPLWCGLLAASVFKDFLSKPFSFGMPGQQAIWRRTVSAIGLGVSAACALVFLISQTGPAWGLAVSVWQAFLLCMAAYALGVLLTVATPNTSFWPAIITLLLVVSLDVDVSAGLRVSVQKVLLASPLVTTAACAIVLMFAWRVLGARSLARKVSDEAFLPLHSIWSGNRQAVYSAQRRLGRMGRAPGAVMKSMENFFLSRMRSRGGHPLRTTLWGTLYILAGRAAPAKASYLILGAVGLAVLTVVLGFYHPENFPPGVSLANMVLFLVCVLNADYRINPYSSLLLNTSRKNRFTSLMLAGLVQLTVVVVISGVLVLISHAAGAFLDEVTVGGGTGTYDPIIPKSFFFFAPMLPFIFLSQILFPKQTVLPIILISIVAVIVFASAAQQLLDMFPLGVVLLQVVCWLPFVTFVRHYCYHWDLKLDG